MLRHIGLNINSSEDVEYFYKNVLGFELIDEYYLHPSIVKTFLNCEQVKIFRVKKFNLVLELILTDIKNPQSFSHIALEFWKPENIFEKAKNSGYAAYEFIKETGSKARYIIDNSGNIFEIKSINLIE
ncbi:MAG: VOC family protein [Bacteroidales bacterium]|jgi:catechol 2,3-dioxygenase-like lactoylglutathione lyase family enzyme|nr:hypothetical protein [Bacteroidales bacterium]MDI9576332.1 hypothetical protein [Bacteroidota bacterium]MDD2593593.1 hypothetical protein [Bacteroidales bacterium]MDD3756127.1 hypothetical protein [Bacteroidales bacterium]MDY0401366.1 hypothetical protein [Bacteroidales bacterium]